MTPAIKLLKKQKIAHKVHTYQHDKNAEAYGLEAAEKLNLPAEQVFKTLVVELETGQLVVAIIPVAERLNMKQIARAVSAKKAVMAAPDKVMRSTGYVLGGVSPLGQKKRLQTVIDSSAQTHAAIYISGGRRGLDIELAPGQLAQLLNASFSSLT